MKKILLAGVAALFTVSAASAADIPARPYYKAPPPAPIFNWTGMYVGIAGGYAELDTRFTDAGGTTTGDFRDTGWLLGGTLGWNWQAPGSAFVWGIEADLSYVDLDARTNVGCAAPGCNNDLRALGTIRGRAGIAANNWLFYVTGGVAGGDFDQNVPGLAGNSEVLFGWTVGAGVEVAFSGRWSAKLEYLYVDFEDSTIPTPVPTTADPNEVHIIRAGLNYRW
jgi:outer membrane immunogenic protein